MEQKHIDEIDESFLGEEFIDEEDVSGRAGSKSAARSEMKKENKDKMDKMKLKKKAVSKKPERIAEKRIGKENMNKDMKMEEATEPLDEVKITPVKGMGGKESDLHQPGSMHDPWMEENEGDGFFKDVSTWKAITGIAIVLLLLSIFTDGFQFSEGSSPELSLSEAEEKAVNYVNNNLLRAPFSAVVSRTEEVDDLYKVTLSVAGEEVDSYLTKDGKLFFPQGFQTDEALAGAAATADLEETSVGSSDTADSTDSDVAADEKSSDLEASSGAAAAGATDGAADSGEDNIESIPTENLGNDDSSAEEAVVVDDGSSGSDSSGLADDSSSSADGQAEEQEGVKEGSPVEASGVVVRQMVGAKKWLFSPHKLTVHQGDTVEMTLVPEGLSFTLAIPEFEVEQEISGKTVVTFTADKKGTFDFSCSSCEEWRGMTGTIVVE